MAKMQMSLKARALRYLSMREHSRIELQRKLGPHVGEENELDTLLDWLEAADYLSQERFVASLVRKRSARFGNSRILLELQSHGIARDALDSVKGELKEDESKRAFAALGRKYKKPPLDAIERAKYVRFLLQRGFSQDAARVALHSMERAEET